MKFLANSNMRQVASLYVINKKKGGKNVRVLTNLEKIKKGKK